MQSSFSFVLILALGALLAVAYGMDDDDEPQCNGLAVTADSCERGDKERCKGKCADKMLEDCCSQRGVSSKCIGQCNYHKWSKEHLCHFNSIGCSPFLNIAFYCGNLEISAEDCCRAKNVPEECMEFCKPERNFEGGWLLSKSKCLDHADTIAVCKKRTHKGKYPKKHLASYTPTVMTPEEGKSYRQLFQVTC